MAKIHEFNYVLLSVITTQNYTHSLTSSIEELLEEAKINMDEKLYDFVNEILIKNRKDFKSFQELRSYLVFLFPTFHTLFFDPLYIS